MPTLPWQHAPTLPCPHLAGRVVVQYLPAVGRGATAALRSRRSTIPRRRFGHARHRHPRRRYCCSRSGSGCLSPVALLDGSFQLLHCAASMQLRHQITIRSVETQRKVEGNGLWLACQCGQMEWVRGCRAAGTANQPTHCRAAPQGPSELQLRMQFLQHRTHLPPAAPSLQAHGAQRRGSRGDVAAEGGKAGPPRPEHNRGSQTHAAQRGLTDAGHVSCHASCLGPLEGPKVHIAALQRKLHGKGSKGGGRR